MSSTYLTNSGKKGYEIWVDKLTVTTTSQFDGDMKIDGDIDLNGDFQLPDPFEFKDSDIIISENLRVGTTGNGNNLSLQVSDINLDNPINVNLEDDEAAALTIQEGANDYMVFNSTNGSEKISIEKDLDFNSSNLDMSTQSSNIKIIDNNASALSIQENSNDYVIFDSTNGSEKISIEKDLDLNSSNLDMSSQASNIKILDNDSNALKIQEASNDYMIFDSTDAAENITSVKPFNCGSTLTVDGSANLGGDVVFADQPNSRLGINTATPQFDLHMLDPSYLRARFESAGGNSEISLFNSTSDVSGFLIGRYGDECVLNPTDTNGYLTFTQEGNAVCHININGLVMVGAFPIVPVSNEVSQGTNINTTVASDGQSLLITTQSASTAADGNDQFTLNNLFIKATSKISLSINNYSGTFSTNGIPVVSATGIASGTCEIVISNCHSANALSGTLKISVNIF